MTESEKPRATIDHKFIKNDRPSNWNLLSTYGVLSTLPDRDHSQSVIYRTKVLQSQVRFQMYRWITENPDQAKQGTYDLNCPPTGLLVHPKTAFCNNPVVCPWCFVRRRLIPAYDAIREVPPDKRSGHKILALRVAYAADTEYGPGNKLPFLRRDRGPHSWVDSLVTIQTVTPFVAVDDEDRRENEEDKAPSRLEHVFHVIQIVPNEVQPIEVLNGISKRNGHSSDAKAAELPYTMLTDVVRVLSQTYQLPWMQLYAKRNLANFSLLKNCYSKRQLLRVNSYKKGES